MATQLTIAFLVSAVGLVLLIGTTVYAHVKNDPIANSLWLIVVIGAVSMTLRAPVIFG